MCGIVGVVGNRNATDILMQGLEKLEYRGYDSAGIFVTTGKTSSLVKSIGRIADLHAKIGIDVVEKELNELGIQIELESNIYENIVFKVNKFINRLSKKISKEEDS